MKYAEEIKLFNVYYNYDKSMPYEATTDNFEKWLEQHNQHRADEKRCGLQDDYEHENEECTCYESADEFEVQEVSLILFEKEEV